MQSEKTVTEAANPAERSRATVPPLSSLCIRFVTSHAELYDAPSQRALAAVLRDLEEALPMSVSPCLSEPNAAAALYRALSPCLEQCRSSLAKRPKAGAKILTELHDSLEGVPDDVLEGVEVRLHTRVA